MSNTREIDDCHALVAAASLPKGKCCSLCHQMLSDYQENPFFVDIQYKDRIYYVCHNIADLYKGITLCQKY